MIKKEYTKEQIELFEKLHDSREADMVIFKKRRHRQYMEGIINKYSESAHFIYELLQNADDAKASKVEIKLTSTGLFFKHNGLQRFTLTDVDDEEDENKVQGDINAITGTGFSTKDEKGEDNKIGKFGIGFKAVYQYTDEPFIYDEIYCFKLIDKIVPCLLYEDHPNRQKNETLFYLPFREDVHAYEKIHSRLQNLNKPNFFLKHLKEILWVAEGKYNDSGKFTKKVDCIFNNKNFPNIKCELLRYNSTGKKQKMWMFTKSVYVDGEKKQDVSVVYYLKPNGELDTDVRPPLYCFFPMKISFDMCFAAHAPFELIDSRQNIKEDSDINIELQREIVSLAADALVCLRDIGVEKGYYLINENLSALLPSESTTPADGLISDFTAFGDVVRQNALVLSVGKKYLPINQVWYSTPIELEYLLTATGLKQLVGIRETVDFIDRGDKKVPIDYTKLKGLGLNEITSELFAEKFNDGFVNRQNKVWARKFYSYLQNDARKLWKGKDDSNMRNKSIIYSVDGKWLAPYEINDNKPKVYLPSDDFLYGECTHFAYVDKDLAKEYESFFKELGLSEPSEYDYVDHEILPKYREKDISIEDEILKKDFWNVLNIFEKVGDEDKKKIKDLLHRDYKMLGVFNSDKSETYLYELDKLYISTKIVEDFYEGYDSSYVFDDDYYINEEKGITKDKIIDLVAKLGVKNGLTIKKVTSWYKFDYDLRHVYYKDVSTTKGYDEYIEGCEDYMIEGFNRYSSITDKRSHAIWSLLCSISPVSLETYKRSRCKAYRKYCTNYAKEFFSSISSLLYGLINYYWIVGVDGTRYKPSDLTLEQFKSFGYDDCPVLTSSMRFKQVVVPIQPVILPSVPLTEEQKELQKYKKHLQELQDMGYTEEDEYRILKEHYEKEKRKKQKDAERKGRVEEIRIDEEDYPDYLPGKSDEGVDEQEKHTGPVYSVVDVANSEIEPEGDDWRRKVEEKQKEKNQQELDREELKRSIDEVEEYTTEWYMRRLKLECLSANEYSNSQPNHSLSIVFSRVETHLENNVLIFKSPSKQIPLWLESVDSFTMELHFSNQEDVKQVVFMPSVKDYSLRVKVAMSEMQSLSQLNWNCFTKADIEFNTPVDLVSSLRSSFEALGLDGDYDLRDGLDNNVSFIFGPPGTGKTTYLSSNVISPRMSGSGRCRMLVMAPTNKACDVIARKLIDENDDCIWLGRFVATADDTIDEDGFVCDRRSDIVQQERCCVVSTTARLAFDFFEDADGKHYLKDIDWDIIVFDEASMIHLAEITYAIYKFYGKSIIIAGDPKQIQPVDAVGIWNGKNIYTMVNLDSFDNPKTYPIQFDITNLSKQWRSIEPIGGLFSHYAYNGLLEHARKNEEQLSLNIPELPIKPITFIPFKVNNFDSLYGAKKLGGSHVHLYSAILASEFVKMIARRFEECNQGKELSIGVICPYTPQAQIIQKLIEQSSDMPSSVSVTTGTVHSFQGGQCNVVVGVLNPPKNLKNYSRVPHVNNENILNVTISRAMDYLCLFVPDRDSDGYEKLTEIHRLVRISRQEFSTDTIIVRTRNLEKVVFGGEDDFLDTHAFVTSHQLANVFSPTNYRYEIRIDDNSVDIQVGNEDAEEFE